MNRIYIIGNGFDLAHGLPTGYHDFLKHLIKGFLRTAYESKVYEDSVFKVERKSGQTFAPDSIDEFLKRIDTLEDCIHNEHIQWDFLQGGRRHERMFKIDTANPFIKYLLPQFTKPNWSDIEQIYYEYLRLVCQGNDTSGLIVKTNNGLEYIRKKLIEYLEEVTEKFSYDDYVKKNPEVSANMRKFLLETLPTIGDRKKGDGWMLVVDFNYTDLWANYSPDFNSGLALDRINIHGSLYNPDNVIFGYGNVRDDQYIPIQNSRVEGVKSNDKNVLYTRTGANRRLKEFMDGEKFDVCIIGHSCAHSDGRLLQKIFEHENIKDIFMTYYKSDETDAKVATIGEYCPNIEVADIIFPIENTPAIPSVG